MKEIQVPANVIVKIVKEDKSVEDYSLSFKEYLLSNPLKDMVWGTNVSTLLKLKQLNADVEAMTTQLTVSDDDYQLLLQLTCNPKNAYNPEIGLSILSFLEAVANAKDVVETEYPATSKRLKRQTDK